MKAGVLLVAATSLALGLGMGIRPDDTVQREGSGARRTALNQMELKAAPNIWADLTDWNGTPVTAESTKGKVVVIGTWASYYKTSHSALTQLQKIADKYKDVVVVGVHNEKGWDDAKKVATDLKVTIPFAHDAKGAVKNTLQVDQDPDFYVIDRAGNMRYADVVTGSVESAVAALEAETAAEAAGLPGRLADAAAKATRDAAKSTTITDDVRPGQLIDVNFPLPDPSLYKEAQWPEKNAPDGLMATDVQGSTLPKPLGSETWLSKKVSTNGRVIVLDFWATWCGPCKRSMPKLDALHKDNKADLVIMGISDENRSTVENFLRDHQHPYSMLIDESRVVMSSLQVQGIPHCVVISTDGIVRWQGNPLDPKFVSVVKKTIEADPGVASRRKAEAEFLKTKSAK